MNGLISRPALRFSFIATLCLLSGFITGANFNVKNFEMPFSKKEINYSKIAWISGAFDEKKVSLATVDYPASELLDTEIKLAEFHLPTKKIFARKTRSRHENFQRLSAVVEQIYAYDVFEDYRLASEKMQKKFLLVMNSPAVKVDEVVIAASSAKKLEVTPVKPVTVLKRSKPRLNLLVNKKMNTQKTSIQTKIIQESSKTEVSIPVKTQNIQIKAPVIVKVQAVEEVKTVKSSAKSADELLANKIEDQLLEQHIQSYVKKERAVTQQLQKIEKIVEATADEEVPTEAVSWASTVESSPQTDCKLLPKLHLIKPMQGGDVESIQICPEHNTWISKSWNGEGWTKVETEGYFPFLTYYPQINSNKTLLLDQNSVALLAIKSGVHFAKGMGMILGSVPQGYKVEFSGRAEEVEYFELNSKKYFIILNVEPGAGVTELVSEKNQNENATVFTPVLGDVATYLDFAAPVSADLPIKIVKNSNNKKTSDFDVAGLTVGISTQTQIQAITQNNGTTILKNVRMIPGYPVFVDVSSKLKNERSYQYRYQLNKRTRNGVFVLKQYPEKQIYQWLKQIKTNLSDQSAMVFGQLNRKRLDGFKKHYAVKVESITENFGMIAKSYSVLWDEKLSDQEPLEGDHPRYLAVQVPEGLAQAHLVNENNQIIQTSLIPVSPRVINVVSE